jgi:hypothetical protein
VFKKQSPFKPLILGAIVGLLGWELVLRILPVKNAHDFAPNTVKSPVLKATAKTLREPIDWKFSQTQYRRINNQGFVDDVDWEPGNAPVAIIGDSFVQSSMLPYAQTLSGLTNDRLTSRNIPVYSYGIPSYSLAGYIGTAEYATKNFQPRAYVFLITKGDLDESLLPTTGSYYLNQDHRLSFKDRGVSKAKQLLSSSALYRYTERQLYYNWESIIRDNLFKVHKDKAFAAAEPESLEKTRTKTANSVLDYLSQKTSVNPRNTIFILDTDRDYIYGKKPKLDRDELSTFDRVANARGYRTIDSHTVFNNYYRKNRKQLDFLPTDFHWNAKGHQLIFNLLEPELEKILAPTTGT